MDIVGTARKIERRLTRSVDAALGELVGRPSPTAIEIVHAVVELAEQRVQDVGRGRRAFPFNRVVVHVLAPAGDREVKARIEAILEGPPSLTDRLVERLRSLGCQTVDLSSHLVFSPVPGPNWESSAYHVEFLRVTPKAPPVRAASAPPPLVRLAPLAGVMARRAFVCTGPRIDIGRGTEVLDSRQRITRTNQVAFVDEDSPVNRTVSRRHAHITYTAVPSEYRICDDRSVHGTAVVRDGRTIPVPPGPRGVRLRSGDEIVLGQARLRVVIEPDAAPGTPAIQARSPRRPR
jgi:pSer/pThr/pTyr-binding forkhead associated (FHA) protein